MNKQSDGYLIKTRYTFYIENGWNLDKQMTPLSTCHLGLVALDGFLVKCFINILSGNCQIHIWTRWKSVDVNSTKNVLNKIAYTFSRNPGNVILDTNTK